MTAEDIVSCGIALRWEWRGRQRHLGIGGGICMCMAFELHCFSGGYPRCCFLAFLQAFRRLRRFMVESVQSRWEDMLDDALRRHGLA